MRSDGTDVRLQLRTKWSDGKKNDERWLEPRVRGTGKRGTGKNKRSARTDAYVGFFGREYYFHRVVAFAYGNTPALSWEEYGQMEWEGGEQAHVWEADHTDGRNSCVLHHKRRW